MDIPTINSIVTRDAIGNNLDNEYTESDLIAQFYPELRCNYIVDPQLLANSIRFRLVVDAPQHLLPDYTPAILGENQTLISFVNGVLTNFYANTSIELNFSFSLLLSSNDYLRYLYASGNFLAFPIAHTVHNDVTRHAFLERLRNFSVNTYINNAAQSLSIKYDECSLLPLAINIFVRRMPNIVYGKVNNNGLSRCCSKSKPQDLKNNCFFNAISRYFDFKDNHIIKLSAPKRRPNKKVSRKIKDHFKFFLKFEKKISFSKVFDSNGITERGITEFENFFAVKVDIWSRNYTNLTRIRNEKIVRVDKLNEFHTRTRKSHSSDGIPINLLSVPSLDYKTRHLLTILNPNFFSKKYFCTSCNIRFNKQWRLTRHLRTSAHDSARMIVNSRINQLKEKEILLSEILDGHKLSLDRAFSYVIINFNKDQHFEINFHYKSELFGCFSTTFSHPTLLNCAKYLISTLPKICLPHLASNLAKNALLFSKLGEAAQQLDGQIDSTTDDPKIKEQKSNLDQVFQYVKERFSTVPCFVTSYEQNQYLIPQFIKECLKAVLLGKEEPDLTYKSKLGQYTSVLSLSKDRSIHIISLGRSSSELYADPSLTPSQNCDVFDNLNLKLSAAFKKDFISDRLVSITQLAQYYFKSHLPLATNFGLYSPSASLYTYLQKSVKFGHLIGHPTIVHPNASLKSYITIDFKLFYKSILQNFLLRTGLPIEFERAEAPVFIPNKRLTSPSFANILFSALQTVIDGDLYYELIGAEYRPPQLSKDYRIDCVISSKDNDNHSLSVIEFNGCYHHSCSDKNGNIRECHRHHHNQEKDHDTICKICLAAKQKASPHRPGLWRLKSHENEDSIHPTRKVPHRVVSRESLDREKELLTCGQFKDVHVITECDTIEYWNLPVVEFLERFRFPFDPKNTSLNHTLGAIFDDTLAQKLPIYDPRTKLTTQRVIDLVKSGSLFGFLVISGQAGPKSQALLGKFLPFSTKKNGQMVNSFSMESELISTEYLSYLLNNTQPGSFPDFILTKIHRIFAFLPHEQRMFQSPCHHLDKLLKMHEKDPNFRKIAKSMPNFLVGSFASNFNKSPRLVILSEEDIFGLPQVTYAQKIESLTPTSYSLTMARNQPFKNSSHNNHAIIQLGRMHLLKFFIELNRFCPSQLVRCNTDGATIATPFQFPAGIESNSVFFLDFWLSPTLSEEDIDSYIDFKIKYFTEPSVCPEHRSSYHHCLQNKIMFNAKHCCVNYQYEDNFPLKVRIEEFGDYCIVKGKNQVCSWSYQSNKIHIKCSGLQSRTLQDFISFSKRDIDTFDELLSTLV